MLAAGLRWRLEPLASCAGTTARLPRVRPFCARQNGAPLARLAASLIASTCSRLAQSAFALPRHCVATVSRADARDARFGKDTYEWHEELPDNRIALVTNVRVLMLDRPGTADLLTERCSINWAVELGEILSVSVSSSQAAGGKAAAGPPSAVVLQLRNKTKDRMLSSVVSSRVIQCAPGTDQATRLHMAIRDGLIDLSARVGLARHSTGGQTGV